MNREERSRCENGKTLEVVLSRRDLTCFVSFLVDRTYLMRG